MQTNIKTIYVDMDGIKTSNEAWTIVTTHSLKRPLNFYKDIL